MTNANPFAMNLRCPGSIVALVILAILAINHPGQVLAAEKIWIEPKPLPANQSDWFPGGIETMVANVVQFDAQTMTAQIDGDDSQFSISANRVIWMEPQNRPSPESEAIQLFTSGQYSQALDKLPEVLQMRPPVWRQQWITMMSSLAASRCDRNKLALELVSQLDRRSLPPLVIGWLPIQWENQPPNLNAIEAGHARLSDSSPLVQLVASSWLVSSKYRSEALATLKSLQTSDRPEVRLLSEVLQWRGATPPQVTQLSTKWLRQVDRMPMVLQVGPTKTLINKLESAGLRDQAEPLRWSQELTPIIPRL